MKLAAVLVPALFVTLSVNASADDGTATATPVATLLANPVQLATWLSERDPIVESQRAKVEAAKAATEQARVLPNPQFNFTTGGYVLGQTNDGTPSGNTRPLGLAQTTNFEFGVGELVEIGKRGPRRHAADARAREAGESAVDALGNRLGDAMQALGKLTYASAKRDVAAANLDAAKKLRDNEKIRVDNKDLSPLEYGRIELDTEELELQLGRAEAELASSIALCSATLDAGAPLPATLPDTDASIEQLPKLQAAKLEAEALGADASLANARKIPDPTFGIGYTLDNFTIGGDQHQSLLFSVGFALPFFDRGDHDAAAARANARSLAAEDKATKRETKGLVQALVSQHKTLVTTLQRLEQDSVPKSTQIIAQTQKAFDLGQARLVDLLLVERSHRDLLLEVLDTRFDLFNVRAQLRQALGLDDQIARTNSGVTR